MKLRVVEGGDTTSIEKLTRDQVRQVTEKLLNKGEINLDNLRLMIPSGTKNTFSPTSTITKGEKYRFTLEDRQKINY